MSKRVMIGAKPEPRTEPTIDQWVESRNTESMKRLTIDIPATLHAKIKSACALQGVKMNEEIRRLLEEHFK